MYNGRFLELTQAFGIVQEGDKPQRRKKATFWLVDKPQELSEEDQIGMLKDALVLPIICIGSLLAVPEWGGAPLRL